MGYSGGLAEQQWKARIKAVVPPAPGTHAGTGLLADFQILSATTVRPGFDLDNLLDPVLSAVINGQGWFGGRRPNLLWVAAQKTVMAKPGLRLAVLEHAPCLWMDSQAAVGLDDVFQGQLPSAGAGQVYSTWVERHKLCRLARGNVGVRLDFTDPQVNLGDIANGKAKPLIDGLWPILGGSPGAPDDSRVTALVVRKGIAELGGTVAVEVVGLPEGWPSGVSTHERRPGQRRNHTSS